MFQLLKVNISLVDYPLENYVKILYFMPVSYSRLRQETENLHKLDRYQPLAPFFMALLVELLDTIDCGSIALSCVWVRVPCNAPNF